MTPAQEIVSRLLDKFPDASVWSITRLAYSSAPKVFKSLDATRAVVRGLTGTKADPTYRATHPREKLGQQNPFGKIPPQRNPFKTPWMAVQINGPAKVLLIHDVHIPYHETEPLITALKYGKDRKPDIVLLNGDVIDCHAVSFWQKDPRQRDFPGELRDTRTFLETIRAEFPKARIVYKWGNHEERWESYMYAKAPECLGVEDFELRSLLRFERLRIEEVGEKRPIRLGDLSVIHGHEYRFAISNPVNAARGLFLRAKTYALCGHFHQSSFHSENTISTKSIATWSVGCLCQLHQDYAPLNNWRHGFAWIEVDKDGGFEVENKTIKKGKIYS
jgi:predicted phosphodiesterase